MAIESDPKFHIIKLDFIFKYLYALIIANT